jgi:uncharacterized membrane protein
MNDKLENQLSNLLTWAEQATSTTVAFVSEQTPLYITELLQYNFYLSLVCFVLFGLLLVVGIFLNIIFIKWMKTNNDWEMTPLIFITVIPIIFGIFGTVNNADWVKIKLAPRVYIVDYLRGEIQK